VIYSTRKEVTMREWWILILVVGVFVLLGMVINREEKH
jgi:hypothetical protein